MKESDKFLRNLSLKERLKVIEVIRYVEKGSLDNLDIKKLKGFDSLYRIRLGKIRLIFLRIKIF